MKKLLKIRRHIWFSILDPRGGATSVHCRQSVYCATGNRKRRWGRWAWPWKQQRSWIRTTQGPPAGAFYMLVLKGYCPTTVLGLLLTAQRLYPMLKTTGKWDTLLVWLRIKAATHAAKQAVPAKPAEVLLLREVLPHNLTASRYADLRCMVMRSVWKQGSLVIRVDLPIWKSDRYGRRFFSKTFQLPNYLTLGDIRTLVQTPPDYWRLLQAIKEIAPQLSVHSLRRGAVTTLAPSFEGQEIPGQSAEIHRPDSQQQGSNASTSNGEPPCGRDGESIHGTSTELGTVKNDLKLLWSTLDDLTDEPQVEFTAIQGSSDTAKLLFSFY